MDIRSYQKARREGIRAYDAAIQNHEDPYLPVLEEKQPLLNQLDRVSLGILSIPLSRVIGSVSRGRSYAFANNFMPILELDSELSVKWSTLYESVEEQGLRDPIKALEYMGYYYVIEGNKRVSVMKCMEAEYIEADVSRVLPPRTGDPENIAYFEYCAFSRASGIYDLFFTKPGSYARLSAMPGVQTDGQWTEDDVLSLRKLWHYFYTSYRKVMRDRPAITCGDAFLLWLLAFGYTDVRDDTQEKVISRIRLMQDEFVRRDESVKLIMDREKNTAQPSLITSLFRPSRIKAAFLYTRSINHSAWNYWHDMGRMEVQEKLGDKVDTVNCIVRSRSEAENEIDRLIREGYTAIFATSPVMLNSLIEPSVQHTDVKLLGCSQLQGYYHVRTYYLRFYEAKFLLGLVAGILSKNGKIGYIADYPIYGTPSMINAFAIGARMVNPEAKVYLNWTSLMSYDEKEPFHDPEINVICNRDLTAPNHSSRDSGLFIRSEGQKISMATLIPRWGIFYRHVIEQIQKGTFDAENSGKAAMNYWWGLSSGVLNLVLSNRFDSCSTRLIGNMQGQLSDHSFAPFEGELKDQDGILRCAGDQRLSPADILCMDYLLDNVVGTLPSRDELVKSARALADSQGIRGVFKADPASISWIRK